MIPLRSVRFSTKINEASRLMIVFEFGLALTDCTIIGIYGIRGFGVAV